MGIKDLLRFLKPHIKPVHIKKYAGKRVGIDAYSWLHKGAYSCSMELCLNAEGDKKFQFLNYFMHRINLLRHYKITPVVVFDGCNIPCKASTEADRRKKREANHELAMVKLKEGNANAASELFQRAIVITPTMAHQLIQILRSEKVEFIVAPYEADAQLAYMSSLQSEDGIAAVISEDSDLLAYGCPAVIFKMDRYGNGEEMVLDEVFRSIGCTPSFRSFTMELFTGMCVFAGCDFLPSVPGVGIVTAYNLVSKYRNLDRVLSILKLEKGSQMPEDYPRSFKEALAVFQHARVYDAPSKQLKPMRTLQETLQQSFNGNLDFLGPEMPHSMAAAIAEGKLNPLTMEAFNQFPTSGSPLKRNKRIRAPDWHMEQEAVPLCPKEISFSTISAEKSGEGGMEALSLTQLKLQAEEEMEVPFFNEKRSLDEVFMLEKLVSPSTFLEDKEKASNQNKVLKVPDNNPFKKIKLDEIELNDADDVAEPASTITEVETSEILSLTPQSQISVDSVPIKVMKQKQRRNIDKNVKKIRPQIVEKEQSSILKFFSRV